jgi:hypothetical protein
MALDLLIRLKPRKCRYYAYLITKGLALSRSNILYPIFTQNKFYGLQRLNLTGLRIGPKKIILKKVNMVKVFIQQSTFRSSV